jgi:magnesium-transporting ATPase (P-type)
MITGDNPLTAVHVAREVEIVDRDVLILDVKEGSTDESGSFIFYLYSLLSSVMKLTCYPFIDST